jgi:hypothetical protein
MAQRKMIRERKKTNVCAWNERTKELYAANPVDVSWLAGAVHYRPGDRFPCGGPAKTINHIVVKFIDERHLEIGYHDDSGRCFHVTPCVLEAGLNQDMSNINRK